MSRNSFAPPSWWPETRLEGPLAQYSHGDGVNFSIRKLMNAGHLGHEMPAILIGGVDADRLAGREGAEQEHQGTVANRLGERQFIRRTMPMPFIWSLGLGDGDTAAHVNLDDVAVHLERTFGLDGLGRAIQALRPVAPGGRRSSVCAYPSLRSAGAVRHSAAVAKGLGQSA